MIKYKNITIKKQEKGKKHYCRYRANGKQHYISASTQKECLRLLKIALKKREQDKQTALNIYTFNTWYEKWLELYKIDNVKESTIKDYEYLLKNINKKQKDKLITDFTSLDILEIIKKVNGTRQQQKMYTFLNDIFVKAYKHKIIADNIFAIIEKPKHEKKKTKAFTREEEKTFIKECFKHEYGIYYLVCLYQGLRRGECLALTYLDFDFKNKTLTINKSINEKNSLNNTKNKQSNRIMPLFDKTIALLEKLNVKDTNERIFNVAPWFVHDRFKTILKNAKLKDFKIHELRHTFITRCKEQGVPEHIVQHWVGHEIGSNITASVYTHVNEDTNLLYINKLNNEKL